MEQSNAIQLSNEQENRYAMFYLCRAVEPFMKPGPIWTPLIPSTTPEDKVRSFGQDTPMKRPGQPAELAPAFVLLASKDSSYMTGSTIQVTGGYPTI